MKSIFTLLFLSICFTLSAQWSNTTNQFYDSLDMPVTQAANDQVNPLIIKSDPDGGYFVIWEDYRVTGVGVADIYAQKYDKNGVALWALNGVPVASRLSFVTFNKSFSNPRRKSTYVSTINRDELFHIQMIIQNSRGKFGTNSYNQGSNSFSHSISFVYCPTITLIMALFNLLQEITKNVC